MALGADVLVEGDHRVGLHQLDQFSLGAGEGVVGCNLEDRINKYSWLRFRQLFVISSDHFQEVRDQVGTKVDDDANC